MHPSVPRLIWFTLLLILSCNTAFAWNELGHATVARIAEDRLADQSKTAIDAMLRSQSLVDIASWADDCKYQKVREPFCLDNDTKAWHYIPLNLDDKDLRASDWVKYCRKDSCVVAQLDAALATLSDPGNPATDPASRQHRQLDALRFLVHFVGDIHQPLHVADKGVSPNDDRGGTTELINLPEQNLHDLWNDVNYFEQQTDAQELGDDLNKAIPADQARTWCTGGAADWAYEGYLIAKRDIYPEYAKASKQGGVVQLNDRDINNWRPVVTQRLEQAGVRLAWLLNSLFSDQPMYGCDAIMQSGETSPKK